MRPLSQVALQQIEDAERASTNEVERRPGATEQAPLDLLLRYRDPNPTLDKPAR